MSGCQNCACGKQEEAMKPISCSDKVVDIEIGIDGKCPCGKSKEDCCHKDELTKNSQEALEELCSPRVGKPVC